MSTAVKPFWSSYLPKFVLGVALMLGGTAMYNANYENPYAWVTAIRDLGIPLDPGKTIATVGVFLILFPIIAMFFLKPLEEAINERNTNLEKTFAESESLRDEMTKLKTDYERQLKETEAEARQEIQRQVREAQELRQTLMAEASEKADAYLAKAREEIDAEKAKALTELRLHVTTVALGATERILQENVDTEKNRKLIDDFLATVEVPSA